MQVLTSTVNMNRLELKAWLHDPRHLYASTDTGHTSLRRLASGDHYRDPAFANKVDNFNTRHGLQKLLFGGEVGGSGWSKRAIALRNWGHDPSKPNSPLHDADQAWLEQHEGAAHRRSGRVKNPIVIQSIHAPVALNREINPATPFFAPRAANGTIAPTREGQQASWEYYPQSDIIPNTQSIVPFGDCEITIAILKTYDPVSKSSLEIGNEATKRIANSSKFDLASYQSYNHISPALSYGVARRYHTMPRKPNPPISAWLLPVAQFVMSAAGLMYSSMDLYRVFGSSTPPMSNSDIIYREFRKGY
jgi:hypothetical protein